MIFDNAQTVTNGTFGVEIECFGVTADQITRALRNAGISAMSERYNHNTVSYWKVTTDASIRDDQGNGGSSVGVEVVSPVLSGAEGLRQVRIVVEKLAELGAKVNRTCGLHVHHDAADFSTMMMKNLVKRYAKAEGVLDGLMSTDRRESNNVYLRSFQMPAQEHGGRTTQTMQELWTKLDRATSIQQIRNAAQGCCSICANGNTSRCSCGNRYSKLNLNNFWRTGTVEFRHANSTLNADRVIAWIIFTQSMIAQARQSGGMTPEVYGADRFFTSVQHGGGCPAEVIKYLKRKLKQTSTATTTEGIYRMATI